MKSNIRAARQDQQNENYINRVRREIQLEFDYSFEDSLTQKNSEPAAADEPQYPKTTHSG